MPHLLNIKNALINTPARYDAQTLAIISKKYLKSISFTCFKNKKPHDMSWGFHKAQT